MNYKKHWSGFCRRMIGDECLGALNIEMVEVAQSVGAASKSTFSGGAVVAFCPEGALQVKLLEEACQKSGFIIQPIQVAPSRLSETELRSLSYRTPAFLAAIGIKKNSETSFSSLSCSVIATFA